MFLALFLFGSFWFWALTVGALITIACAVEYERPGFATLTLLATFAALGFFGDVNVLHFATHNPIASIVAVLGYVAVGALWALFKWKGYLAKSVESFEDRKRDWLNNSRYRRNSNVVISEDEPAVIPNELKAEWHQYALSLIPTFRNNKARLTTWMAYWPTSVIWYLLRDWVLKIFESVLGRLKGVFVGMRNRAYADIMKDLPEDFKVRD